MPTDYAAVVALGPLTVGVVVRDDVVTGIDLLPGAHAPRIAGAGLAAEVAAQIRRYAEQPAVAFDLPLRLEGTEFQRRVWRALVQIPPGQTCSYGALAAELGSSARAVGGACRANPIPLIVPCHRVVAAHGLGGFAGQTAGAQLSIKTWLLRHEGVR